MFSAARPLGGLACPSNCSRFFPAVARLVSITSAFVSPRRQQRYGPVQRAASRRGHHAEERHRGGVQRSVPEGSAGMRWDACGTASFTRQGCLSGHYFWVLDKNKVPGPAQGITQTWGVPSPIDTVFTRCNCQGKTYIFKVRLFILAPPPPTPALPKS